MEVNDIQNHIADFNTSYPACRLLALKHISKKNFRTANCKHKPTFGEITRIYQEVNHMHSERQGLSSEGIETFVEKMECRLRQITPLYFLMERMINSPKLNKGNIQFLGGHLYPPIVRNGLIGFKAFLVAIIRDVGVFLKQWTIAFSPGFRGCVLWGGSNVGENSCWWCGAKVSHLPWVLQHGFAAPWCNNENCPSINCRYIAPYKSYVQNVHDWIAQQQEQDLASSQLIPFKCSHVQGPERSPSGKLCSLAKV